ncbi:hypothetical protein [Abyssalbus ytuae]|uniref:Uncharacterized protein n=1 Tax=Abyssalbus ytuae TaxID=2926907 RepID=A0A9E6ZWM9_9FLAO|nr:hypothetical protein [Abyssalbus ytuae]UOB19123.1 hypothetical protein MQE35_07455 [Abyssalbus ytuae]
MSKKVTPKVFEETTTRWKEEDMLQLSQHFHKYDKNSGQYLRARYFVMNADDVDTFNAIKEITDMKIYLALNEGNKEKLTFFPILQINDEHLFELSPETKVGDKRITEFVPATFKEMICKNWDDSEIHIIDDLFTVKKQQTLQRVLFYHTSDNIISFINTELLGNIKDIILYPGIDMNKFQYKEMISFTPVLAFKQKEKKNYNTGLIGVIESVLNDEVFIEYLTPCPPTCPEE